MPPKNPDPKVNGTNRFAPKAAPAKITAAKAPAAKTLGKTVKAVKATLDGKKPAKPVPDWTVETFDDTKGKPRFRVKGKNGEIVAQSEGYEDSKARDKTARKLASALGARVSKAPAK